MPVFVGVGVEETALRQVKHENMENKSKKVASFWPLIKPNR